MLRMLQEFYLQAKQDGKPCHATYILSGFIEEAVSASTSDAMQLDGEEFVISSLPVATQESSTSGTPPSKLVRTVVLANEDDVQGWPCYPSIYANLSQKQGTGSLS